jgi:hypothetical protein
MQTRAETISPKRSLALIVTPHHPGSVERSRRESSGYSYPVDSGDERDQNGEHEDSQKNGDDVHAAHLGPAFVKGSYRNGGPS